MVDTNRNKYQKNAINIILVMDAWTAEKRGNLWKFLSPKHLKLQSEYSTRIEELTNSREAISAKPLGIKLKFFTLLCTYRSSILHKVLERIREFHFFFTKKIFSVFLLILTTKITHKKKFFHMYISKTHLHKIHFLLEIFRPFLGLRHPKLKKHKKWNISSGFQ